MTTMVRLFIFLLLLVNTTACSLDEQEICGSWQAVAFFEDGKPIEIPLDSVQLRLWSSNKYHFKSIGMYSEAGHWESTANYLSLTDTTNPEATQKLIKVIYQSSDSLKVKMEHQGKEQVLFFGKNKLDPSVY